jgi:hypothetical protein
MSVVSAHKVLCSYFARSYLLKSGASRFLSVVFRTYVTSSYRVIALARSLLRIRSLLSARPYNVSLADKFERIA